MAVAQCASFLTLQTATLFERGVLQIRLDA
jgi:hypothetical protein